MLEYNCRFIMHMNKVAIVGALTVKVDQCEMGMLSEMLYALKVPPLVVAYRYTMLHTHTPMSEMALQH